MTFRPHKAGSKTSDGLSLNLFTDDELDSLHLATLEILANTGVYVQNEKPKKYFLKPGPPLKKTE
jgi:trimethylamine--corrinoid protein Co-methyltransferase